MYHIFMLRKKRFLILFLLTGKNNRSIPINICTYEVKEKVNRKICLRRSNHLCYYYCAFVYFFNCLESFVLRQDWIGSDTSRYRVGQYDMHWFCVFSFRRISYAMYLEYIIQLPLCVLNTNNLLNTSALLFDYR